MLFVGTTTTTAATTATAADTADTAAGSAGSAGSAVPMLHDPRFLPDDDRVGDVARALLAGWLAGAQLLADGVRLAS
jgi:hypothetical protein